MRKLTVWVALSSVAIACSTGAGEIKGPTEPPAETGQVTATVAAVGPGNIDTTPYAADFFNGSISTTASSEPGGVDTTLLSSMTSKSPTATTVRLLHIELFGKPAAGDVFTIDTVEHDVMGATVSYEIQLYDLAMNLQSDPSWGATSGSITIDSVDGASVTFHASVVLEAAIDATRFGEAATGQAMLSISGRIDGVVGL